MPATPLYVPSFDVSTTSFSSTDDVTGVAYDCGGTGAPLVFGHATGLHGQTYLPLMALLRERFHCYAIDVRAQGHTSAPRTPTGDEPPHNEFAWSGVQADFCRGLDALGLSGRGDVFGIGHSQGGFSVMSSALALPGTFAGIFGFEPVVFPFQEHPREGDNYMANNARRRREVFESKQAAYVNYKTKPPFSLIDDDCLRAYVEYGFEPNPEPELDRVTAMPISSVRLRCRAENEARLYEAARTKLLAELPKLTCEVIIGCSEFTNDSFKSATHLQADALPNGRREVFNGRSHFGLIEGIEEMAKIITGYFG